MIIAKTEDNYYTVKMQMVKSQELIEDEAGKLSFVTYRPPILGDREIHRSKTKEEAHDYISKELNKTFRYSSLRLKDLSYDWMSDAVYDPISKDLVEKIKKEIMLPMKHDASGIHRQYTHMTVEEQTKYKEKQIDIFLERLWKAFEKDNYNGTFSQNGSKITLWKFTNEDINEYKKSSYYDAYIKEIMSVFTKLVNEYVKEPPVIVTPTSPQTVSEAVENITYNVNHKEKRTAPSLTSGWVCYIFFMILEVIFVGTIGLWIPTTILFILWRRKELRKYNWDINERERKHFDPWRRKY